jgi:hypothetical protein
MLFEEWAELRRTVRSLSYAIAQAYGSRISNRTSGPSGMENAGEQQPRDLSGEREATRRHAREVANP